MIKINIKKTLKDFNLNIDFQHNNGIFVLFGKSGCGKTVTLNCIAGFDKINEGNIIINNKKIYSSEEKINIIPSKRKIGYITQQPYLFPNMSVKKNLLYSGNKNKKLFNEIIKILKIDKLINRSVDKLSGGEKQRISIGRSLLSEPEFLIMDEPTSALDNYLKISVLKLIKQINKKLKLPIIYVTHNIQEVEYLADYIGIIQKGKIIKYGRKEEIFFSNEIFRTSLFNNFTNIWEGIVLEKNKIKKYTKIQITDKTFIIPFKESLILQQKILISVSPSDIIVASKHPNQLSARNIYCGIVKSIFKTNINILLKIDCGFNIYSSVTEVSLIELNIKIGSKVHFIFKTQSCQIFENFEEN